MEFFLYAIWFVVSFPALPLIGLWSLAWKPSHGTSGNMGLFFVSSFAGGFLIWFFAIMVCFFGKISIPHISITWS